MTNFVTRDMIIYYDRVTFDERCKDHVTRPKQLELLLNGVLKLIFVSMFWVIVVVIIIIVVIESNYYYY